jgi:hypothetical protein
VEWARGRCEDLKWKVWSFEWKVSKLVRGV